jgi:hypothetical protein
MSEGLPRMLHRFALLAVTLSACTGTSTYYPSGQPQYAQQTTTTQSADGSQVQTSTSTYQTTTYDQQPQPEPAAYQPPQPAPPPPSSDGPRCDPRDNREMCIAIGVIYDVGRLLERLEERSCGKAARALNRYADENRGDIDVMLSLDHTQTRPRLRQFMDRHQADVELVIAQAMDLDSRCGGDDRFDRAMRRIGFRGLLQR